MRVGLYRMVFGVSPTLKTLWQLNTLQFPQQLRENMRQKDHPDSQALEGPAISGRIGSQQHTERIVIGHVLQTCS
jgi:hypothetical protein